MVKGRLVFLTGVITLLMACNNKNGLQGKWEYGGGTYNGKAEGKTEGYMLERDYTADGFEAFMIEGEGAPQKYQAGTYKLQGDTCIETETFSSQQSKLTNVAVHYNYHLQNDTLVLKGTLPTGMQVEEHWIRMSK